MDTNRIHKSLKTSAQNGGGDLPTEQAGASPYNIDFEVIGEDRYHWILENEAMGMKLEWAKTQAPSSMQHGAHIRLKIETSEKEDQQKMENLRQLLRELIR